MHNGGVVSLAALIGLILLGFRRKKGAFLSILVVLAVIIVCGCSGGYSHHHC